MHIENQITHWIFYMQWWKQKDLKMIFYNSSTLIYLMIFNVAEIRIQIIVPWKNDKMIFSIPIFTVLISFTFNQSYTSFMLCNQKNKSCFYLNGVLLYSVNINLSDLQTIKQFLALNQTHCHPKDCYHYASWYNQKSEHLFLI